MKKGYLFIAGILTLFLVAGLAIQFQKYYNNTYVASEGYTRVPLNVPQREKTRDGSGKVIEGSYSYQYEFVFITREGNKKNISFELTGENVTPFKPGQYLKAKVSNTRVVYGPSVVKQDDIPQSVLKKITLDK
jgi:Protein of unknown function (DUF1093).